MNAKTINNTSLYALLIGINYYFPNQLDGGVNYGHLNGCVRDVEQMESFLKMRLGVSDDHITKLTASHNTKDKRKPVEAPSDWPTFDNIVAGFQRLHDTAQEGDQVVIHYSGHGGRAKSIYPPELKTTNYDEGFAPTDIGTGQGRYLRDLDMAKWLQKLADKGLIVTAILDCCHSGGMTRGDAVARGSTEIDTAVRPAEQTEVDSEAIAIWQSLLESSTRSDTLKDGGLPASNDWVVIAACRPQESAYEYAFDGKNKSGALTHWLIDILNGSGLSISYKQLHQQLVARIQSKFSKQRPQLFGDGDRAVFGQDHVEVQFAASILKYSEQRNEVMLNVGSVQGVQRGAEFTVFSLEATELTDFDSAVAQVRVKHSSATESIAAIDELTEGSIIELGAQAVLVNPSSVKLRNYVRLQREDDEGALPSKIQATLKEAHEAAQFSGFIEWVEEEGISADFIVVAQNGFYEIWDTAGEVIPRINPPLALDDIDAPAKVISRLIHLTRYRNVQRLINSDSRSRGAPSILLEWLNVITDHVFTDGDVAQLLVRNDSKEDIEITILALEEDWSVTQVYPNRSDSYTFAPYETEIIEIETYVKDDRKRETTIYKLFATIKGTNFRMLELPSLDKPLMKSGTRSPKQGSELEQLLSSIVDKVSSTRSGQLRTSAGRQWTTTQVEMIVCKPETAIQK